MNAVQQGLLTLLEEIDDICSRNGITYYLGGGTALGAVRHQGFLPWDDDSDLYITRDNWKKLLSVIDDELPDNRELVCDERFPEYRNPIGRYMNLDSTWIYQSQMFSGVPAGQHVEFLILDPMPANEESHHAYLELFQVYAELLGSYFVVNRLVSVKNDIYNPELYSKWHARMKAEGREAVLKELESMLYCYSDEECDRYHLRHGFEYHVYTKKNFGKQRYVPYEYTKMPVAERAEAVFREAYGDSWKKVPTVENQVIHSSTSSLTVPYTEYWKRSKEKVNYKKAHEIQLDWKAKAVDIIPIKNQVEFEARDMASYMNGQLAEYRYSDPAAEYDMVDFNTYYGLQMEAGAVANNSVFAVAPQFAEQAVVAFLKEGTYWKSRKLLMFFAKNGAFSEIVAKYQGYIDQCRQIDAHLDLVEIDEAAAIAAGADLGDELCPLVLHGVIARELEAGGFAGERVPAYVSRARELFPEYSFFKYVEGRLLEDSDPAAARELYRQVIEESLDGLVIIDAKARMREMEGSNE